MCLIAIKGSGVALPKDKYLLHAETRNSDGIGIMYRKPNSEDVHIKKDFLNATEMIKWIKENIQIEDQLVIHFRLATHGLKDIGNRHPFPITKNKELLRMPELVCQVAVAHNGVLTTYGHHAKFSDTQKFVLDILSDDCVKNNLDSEAVQKLINSFIDGDKLAILRNDGVCYRFGEWVKDEGIFYSNDGYKPTNWVTTKFNNWRDDRDYNASYGYGDYGHLGTGAGFETKEALPANKDAAWVAQCDGCKEKKYVRVVEIEENVVVLCKKCRKLNKKGKLDLDVTDIEAECVCDSCGEFVEEKELTDLQLDGGMRVCKVCHQSYIEGGCLPIID